MLKKRLKLHNIISYISYVFILFYITSSFGLQHDSFITVISEISIISLSIIHWNLSVWILINNQKKKFLFKQLFWDLIPLLFYLILVVAHFTFFKSFTVLFQMNNLELLAIISTIYFSTILLFKFPNLFNLLARKRVRATHITIGSFGFLIFIGTVLLSLPGASSSSKALPLIDAVFTSVSAVCVTGLTTVSTGNGLSLFGQIVVLILIQLGGLGLMTIASFLAIFIGRGINLQSKRILQQTITTQELYRVSKVVVLIFISTIIIEASGTLLLFFSWSNSFDTKSMAFYYSVFHSISAFCNAGFSLWDTSLIRFHNNIPVNLIVSSLILIGGIGFSFIYNILQILRSKLSLKSKKHVPLTVQSKIVFIVSVCLIIFGMITFFIFEANSTLYSKTLGEKLLASFFQSVTSRTAGFNTVDFSAVGRIMLFVFLFLMFIGASSGSTGGGIKVNTFACLIIRVFNTLRGKDNAQVFNRQIPTSIINLSLSLVVVYLLMIFLFTLVILIIEPFNFEDILFEVFSAFGTVGLSTGITPKLSVTGKCLIIILMFVGRIGPLTLAMSIGHQDTSKYYQYPEEKIMIG